jgi:predicted TIM-barrel fold metal-dependent hydrolase
MRIDIHQHIWTEPLLGRLAARRRAPLIRRSNGLTVLHTDAEQPYIIDVVAEEPGRRAALVREEGLDRAVIALSSPIGIEALPRDEALDLIAAYLEGVAELPPEFAAWGPIALDGPDPDDVDALIDRGCVGISMPAGALAGPERLDIAGPILERTADRGVPLFVHPGRAPGQHTGELCLDEPLWWRALTDYVAQMQAAWLTFEAIGRREHPGLIVVFAMLAGGAPWQRERLVARGGPAVEPRDPSSFYDSSSYGPVAVETMARLVGERHLLYGSDRPVIEPESSDRDASLQTNASKLVPGLAVAA